VKLVRVRTPEGTVTGRIDGDIVVEIAGSLDELVRGAEVVPTGRSYPLDEMQLVAPVPDRCRGLLCTGINYVAHQEESSAEFSAEVPDAPIFFIKTLSAVTGPFSDLVLPAEVSSQFDWEVELGVVIGRGGRDIAVEDAADHVFGYTVVNDITARDLQRRHQQWLIGKNVDRSTPIGPWIVTADELGFPPSLGISLQVNGVQKQGSDTTLMIFDIATQISILSRSMALEPGDVISTGTPSGVGFTRTPAEFLRDGDVVEATVDGVGTLRNVVRTKVPSEQVLDGADPVGSA
jgi:2-keto-4-pentenoate hydratase/2-oxohepta-3-ene-1,7-dioic acid hydratase in catechol pathway